MQQVARQSDITPPLRLAYAGPDSRRPASWFGWASLAMAGVTIAWLTPPYLCWRGVLMSGPFAGPRGGPISEALTATVLWPIGITFALGIISLVQPRRRLRWLGAVAIGIVCVAFPTLIPGLWR